MKKLTALLLAAMMLISACGTQIPSAGSEIIDIGETVVSERTFSSAPAVPLAITGEHTPVSLDILNNFDPREGFTIAPIMFTDTGIDVLTSFLVRTPTDTPPALSIDGQPTPTLARQEANVFIVIPAVPLTYNSVYTLRIARDGQPSITWAFQTTSRFEIISTLPRHQAFNVPLETGIEFNFSIDGNTNIEEHFSIYPSVEGRFTRHGSTTVFMPIDPLEEGQIYTVTISPGVTLYGTNNTISSELVFSFETTAPSTHQNDNNNASVHFFTSYVEFPSFEAPSVDFWFNQPRAGRTRPPIEVNLYEIETTAQGVAAVNRLTNSQNWARWSAEQNFIDTQGLNRMLSFEVTERQESPRSSWDEAIQLPTNLPPGFYLLDVLVDGNRSQMVIQITDLAVQVLSDNDRTILWINDMTTGLPAAGATVNDSRMGRTYTATDYGIVVLNRALSFDVNEHLLISATDGKQASVISRPFAIQPLDSWDWNWSSRVMWDSWEPWPRFHNANEDYWTVLQLDRTLFQRSDTVNVWGFIQNRRTNENITHVTAEITTGWGWWGHPGGDDILLRQNLSVANGAYSGELRLPHLDPGSYQLSIMHNGIAVSSIFFTVNDYVKPPYQLITSADRVAMFASETVTFTARTEFFEGTPVPDLDINYSLWSDMLNRRNRLTTNAEGIVEVQAGPLQFNAQLSGEQHLSFTAEATLPEIGWVHRHHSVRVFVNDIHLRARASHVRGDATLTINVDDITLDRLNDGTNTGWNDFLDTPTAGQRIDVQIQEIYWVRIRTGERYDFITRQVMPTYRSERRERTLQNFTLTTDSNGEASRNFTIPFEDNPREFRSYMAVLSTTDGNGRRITRNVFIGRDFESFHRMAEENSPFLYGARPRGEGYDIGEEVTLTVKQGTEPLTRGNLLFVVVQNGILSYHVGTNPLTLTFEEKHVPNAQVFAFHFNGHTYHTSGNMAARLNFNTTERELDIQIETCEQAYRPGETATITVRVTDGNGNPVAANVNLSLVDEALFALMDYEVDTLGMLYGRVSDRLRFSMATHRTFISDGINDSQMYGLRTGSVDMAMAAPAAVAESADDAGGWGGGDTLIRERFEDTAYFASARSNASGIATFTIELPHNITSWRVTASAISEDLYAGHTTENLRVTNPMFLHYTLNRTFLAGDTPYIGVNAFGTALAGGERVTFEVWREDNPNDIRTATGVAFERVNIPLWQLTQEGMGAIIVHASAAGYSDAVRHEYQVVASHRLVDVTNFYSVTANTVFELPATGMTNITFTDHGRGQFLSDLFALRNIWRNGLRLEGLIAQREATRLMAHHFPTITLWGDTTNFNPLDYQTSDGGIAMLPHASSELRTTVMVLPFILEEINQPALRNYLLNAYTGSNMENRMLALYGLSILGEPILIDLQRYAALPNLSVRNAAYVALGLITLGENQAALELYNRVIAPNIQEIAPYYRVQMGSTRNDILDATSITALLAAQLGLPQAIGLFNYANRNWVTNPLLNIERLAFIHSEIENHSDATASITYRLHGDTITRELGLWDQFTLRLPVANMADFQILSTTGEVGAVSIVRTPLEDIEIVENNIGVTRTFFRAGTNTAATTFAQDELVRVQIAIRYPEQAVTGSYVITDFLPAGLALVQNSARFGDRITTPGRLQWATAEGQRVTFFDHNGRFARTHTYYYYARVINPGTFTAEGTLVQSLGAREYIAVGESAVITIR